jgi:TolB-like protein/Flp pilus assembly protein TadD/class 3 adenylate cyclase
MPRPVASTVTTCSVCGESLNAQGECVACLIRTALDESVVESGKQSVVFGDFEIARCEDGSLWELGHGGMGVTYLALDNVLRRKVALKVIELPKAARTSNAVRERFLREARAAATLRHRNVATVYQFGASRDGRHCYYAMELVEGETLEARIRRDGPLDSKLVLEIAIQITRALLAAAAHRLIHRDLKPGNIMLTRGDKDTAEFEVKIIDFGLAKAIADAGGETDLTHGAFMGTPNFASPEQFDSSPVDVRSDIYSLGATLWFALTGKAPWGGRNIEDIRSAQKSGAFAMEQLDAARVPSRLRSLLKSMLAFEPAARPGIEELAASLQRCSAREITLEIAHVLFIDIVGYSKLSINEQQAAVDELTQIVRLTEQFQKADAADRLIKIATGDGMALVFYTSPEAPVRCATEICRALKDHPHLPIRMGIHSGPVSGVVDVTGRANLTGAGLNVANRVMECGDAGHILVSKHVAEDLSEFEEWRSLLHDLGTCEVKHGKQVAVINLWSDDVGNRRIPERFQLFRKRRARVRWAAAAAALLLLAGIVAVFVLVSNRSATLTSNIPEKSIAVLPFENLSHDPDNAYLADGIQDEILTRLSKIAGLKVISRTSTQRYRSAPAKLPEIATQLGVAHILEGSVQKSGDAVRVNVQLIKAATDSHVWADAFDRKLSDIFAVESEIATAIAERLQTTLTGAEKHAITMRPTENNEAHQLYLRGRYFWGKRTEDGFRKAIEYFQQAATLDPGYASAYAGIADCYVLLFAWGYASADECLPKAGAAARKALQLDSQLGEAHASLAETFVNELNLRDAKREAERAIELAPNYATAHHWFGIDVLAPLAQHDRAIAELKRAVELDPFSPVINTNLGYGYIVARRYQEAIAQLRKTVELDPNFDFAHSMLGDALALTGQFDEAIAEHEKAYHLRMPHDPPTPLMRLAYTYAMKGDRENALAQLNRAIASIRGPYNCAFGRAVVHTVLGDKSEALNWLEQSYRDKESTYINMIRVHPFLDALRGDPRFEELANRIVPPDLASNPAAPEKSIAVLPFENLSRDPDNAFFADGVQDELLTDLAKIADLKVISRTSVMQYKSGIARNLRQIGQQLGVTHVVEGSVQRADNRVRVSAQLIDARTDRHLWAQSYDRDLANVFVIESDIAKTIADELRAKISDAEKLSVERPPTSDIAAFDLYSHGKLLLTSFRSTERADLLQAIDLLNQAIVRDPSFLNAYCQVAYAHDLLYFLGLDHSPARLALAEAAIQAALRIDPEAGETHLARAENLYRGYLDYDGALAELEVAGKTLSNDPRILEMKGYIQRRQGRWEESTKNLERALELDPLNFLALDQLALSYDLLRRYAEEEGIFDRAIAAEPGAVEPKVSRALLQLQWRADPRRLHETIDTIRATQRAAIPRIANAWLICALAERDLASAKEALIALGDRPFVDGVVDLNHPFLEGLIARMTKDDEKSRTAFAAARAEQEKAIQAQPSYALPLCALGLIDAGLGRKEEALREGRRAVELLPMRKDAFYGPLMTKYLAMIAAWVDDNDLAFEQLTAAVRPPSRLSYGELKLLPFWDPLRGDPRFEKIVASLAPK